MRIAAALALLGLLAPQESPVDPWRKARVKDVVPGAGAHSIHSYYVSTPESPDGKGVLYFTSTTRECYEGEVRILERATGKTTTLASKVVAEDAHRTACQQWLSKGKRVVYHDFRDGEWVVVCVDVDSLQQRVLAKGRQVGFGA